MLRLTCSVFPRSGNCLSALPSSVGSLSSLRTLDLSDNLIEQLPDALVHIRTLEVCVCACLRVFTCVCVCVCVFKLSGMQEGSITDVVLNFVFVCVCLCVCVCVCDRASPWMPP